MSSSAMATEGESTSPDSVGEEEITSDAAPDSPETVEEKEENGADDSSSPPKKKTRGRVKIGIKLIDQKQKRSATFHKRKGGLMKKGFELSVLTGAEVLVLASWGDSVFSYSTKKLQKVLTSQTGQDLIHHCLKTPADDVTDEEVAMRWNPEGYVERELALPRSEKRKRMKMLREQLMTSPSGKTNSTTAQVPQAPQKPTVNLAPLSPTSGKATPDLNLTSLQREVPSSASASMSREMPREVVPSVSRDMPSMGQEDSPNMDLFLQNSGPFMPGPQIPTSQMSTSAGQFMASQQMAGNPMGNPNSQAYMPNPQMPGAQMNPFVKPSVMGGVFYGGYQPTPGNRYVFLPPHGMPNKPIQHMGQLKMQNTVFEHCGV